MYFFGNTPTRKHTARSKHCSIEFNFNGQYTSFLTVKENNETRVKWNPTSKPKLQQHRLTIWILLLHCTQQILSEAFIIIRHRSIEQHLNHPPQAAGARVYVPLPVFWSVGLDILDIQQIIKILSNEIKGELLYYIGGVVMKKKVLGSDVLHVRSACPSTVLNALWLQILIYSLFGFK